MLYCETVIYYSSVQDVFYIVLKENLCGINQCETLR